MFENTHFPKAKKYWHMGEFHDWSHANVHVMSHALHYGTSVFEGIRAYTTDRGPAVFRLSEHIDRLFRSASILQMDIPFTKPVVMTAVKEVLKRNELKSAYIRPLLYFAYGNLGLVPKFSPAELMISAWEWGAYLGDSSKEGVSVFILPWKRVHHTQFNMAAKLGGLYILSTIGGKTARGKGYDEAVFLNMEGNIAEGPGENIFIVKSGRLITNDRSESILEGITRASVLEFAAHLGIETSVRPIAPQDLFQADEAFFSGTAVEIAPITHVSDGSRTGEPARTFPIGSGARGPITKKIMEAYSDIVRGRNASYHRWLTFLSPE